MTALQKSSIREVKAELPQRTTVGPSRCSKPSGPKHRGLLWPFKTSCLNGPVQKFQPLSSQCHMIHGERKALDENGHLQQAREGRQALAKALCVTAGQTLHSAAVPREAAGCALCKAEKSFIPNTKVNITWVE